MEPWIFLFCLSNDNSLTTQQILNAFFSYQNIFHRTLSFVRNRNSDNNDLLVVMRKFYDTEAPQFPAVNS